MRWFEIALVVLTLFTGLVWLVDKLWWRKARAARAGLLDEKEPIVVDYSRFSCSLRWRTCIFCWIISVPDRIGRSGISGRATC